MKLTAATWTDADSVETDLAVLPVGSTEQHGPHAPLGTDMLAAKAIAADGAARAEPEVIVAPTIPVGIAEEHRQFTGTLWVTPETFRSYVRETVASLASHGWNRVVIVNGHGGNVDALKEASARLTRDGTAYTVPFTWFDSVDMDTVRERVPDAAAVSMGHGGPVETSILRHLHPELVRTERLPAADDGGAERWGDWHSGVNLAYDSAEFTENGAVGTPSESSEELGEALHTEAVVQLKSLLEAVAKRDIERPDHR